MIVGVFFSLCRRVGMVWFDWAFSRRTGGSVQVRYLEMAKRMGVSRLEAGRREMEVYRYQFCRLGKVFHRDR